MCYFHHLKHKFNQNHSTKQSSQSSLARRWDSLNSLDSISLSFLPLSSANGVSILQSSLQSRGGCTHVYVPASSAKFWSYSGQNAPPFDPFCLVWPPKLSLGFKNIQRPGAGFIPFLLQSQAGGKVFFPFTQHSAFSMYADCRQGIGQQKPGDSGQTQDKRLWSVGPRPRPIIIHCHTKAPRHLMGCLLGKLSLDGTFPNSTLILFNRIYGIYACGSA